MANAKTRAPCVLCGQPVEITGFSMNTGDGLQKFCCAGCMSIYQLLNEDKKTTITPLLTKNEDV
jgi:hypothetical protein